LIVAGFFGFLLVVFLIVESGAAEVAHAMLVLGWGLLPIALFHFIPVSFDALSWRELVPASNRLSVFTFIWMRWIRESINTLLPVAGVGGDIAGARLAHQRGVPGTLAAASVVVDITVGTATQVVFVIAGAALLMARSSDRASVPLAWALLIGVAAFVAALAAFVLIQHRSMFVVFARLARRLTPEKWLSGFKGDASAIDAAVVATYRRGFALLCASLLHLAGWAAGAGEVWLVMHFLGRPFALTDAFVLESLGQGVHSAAFLVPGALGAVEGGFVLFGALLGLPADIALTISLAKRVRELAVGLPGLIVWQWVEGHYLVGRSSPLSH
jgi:putative membrane protein